MFTTDRPSDHTRLRLRVLAWRLRRPVAALCAGLAVALAVERLRPPDPPTVEVPVAARDLPLGTRLTIDDVDLRAVPVALIPKGLLTDASSATVAPEDTTGTPNSPTTAGALNTGGIPSTPGTAPTPDVTSTPGTPGTDGREAGWPHASPGSVADDDARLAAVLGARLAVAVPAGMPLVPELIADPSGAGPPGTVVVPVRFADAGVAHVLRPGMRVDVIAAPRLDGETPARVAEGAVVLTPSDGSAGTADGSGGSDGADAGGGLLGGTEASPDAPVLLAVTPDESVTLGGAVGTRSLAAVIVG